MHQLETLKRRQRFSYCATLAACCFDQQRKVMCRSSQAPLQQLYASDCGQQLLGSGLKLSVNVTLTWPDWLPSLACSRGHRGQLRNPSTLELSKRLL